MSLSGVHQKVYSKYCRYAYTEHCRRIQIVNLNRSIASLSLGSLFAIIRLGFSLRGYLTLLLLLFSLQTFSQVKDCFCDKNILMNGATVLCDATTLNNNSKLYWQYNCDRIWLTLENNSGQQIVLNEVPVEFYGYTYRLGFRLIKEFDNTILFRSGCPANGPCLYTLIDKSTGNKIEEFNQLIGLDADVNWENPSKYNFDFIVFLSDSANQIIIYFVDNQRKLRVPFKDKLTAPIPQYQFNKMALEINTLTLFYDLGKGKKRTLRIDLNDKKYSR
jgi:hypothetical protein